MKLINYSYRLPQRIFAPVMKKFTLLALTVVFAACTTGSGTLDSQGFNKGIQNGEVQILDVRTPEEFREGHILNAINIDVQAEGFEQASSVLYKDLPVYVYCRSGKRSNEAAERLKKIGFSKVYELEGGILQWEASGLPLEKPKPHKIYPNDTIAFEKAVLGNKLVLADFNAVWCKPCRILQPTIERIHDNRPDDVIVYSIDVDERTDLARQYEAERIPLVLLFKNGKIVHRSEGVVDEATLNHVIDKNL